MADQVKRFDLWDGWSFELPERFMRERNPNGSFAAWDEELAIDIQTISTAGRKDRTALRPEDLLAADLSRSHGYLLKEGGLVGYGDLVDERDDGGPVLRLRTVTAATNRALYADFGFRDRAQLERALRIWRSTKCGPSGTH